MISKIIFKIFLTLSSMSLMITIFFIKQEYVFTIIKDKPQCLSFLVIIVLPIFIAMVNVRIIKFLSDACIENEPISVEEATNSYLPSYLSYFLVSLSIHSETTFYWVFLIMFVFVYFSQVIYFNPILLIFGYKFYYVKTANKKVICLISKKEIAETQDVIGLGLKAINSFTYIENKRG